MSERNKYREKGGTRTRHVVVGSDTDRRLSESDVWKLVGPAPERTPAVDERPDEEPPEVAEPENPVGWFRRVLRNGS